MYRFRIIILLICCLICVHCEICPSMRIKSYVSNLLLLENCTEIDGDLMIALFQTTIRKESDFDGYVFPNLKVISGNLIFYSVNYLTSIGQLFPNLYQIKGHTAFRDYSFILWDLPHLREIGLTNLVHIGRKIRIQRCPELCYGDSVNWTALGASGLHYIDKESNNCKPCPSQCKNNCWNATHCVQMDLNCDSECRGCYKPNSSGFCKVCKHFKNDENCVKSCPADKYEYLPLSKCVSRETCKNNRFNDKIHWVHDRECVDTCKEFYEVNEYVDKQTKEIELECRYCGNNCEKVCNTDDVESLAELEKLKGCTHINGSLTITMSDVKLEELTKCLGAVRYIKGGLKIGRTVMLSSLEFLNNVTYIGLDENDTYSIFIYENQNLQKLWNFNKKLTLKGRMSFHDNPLLCIKEILKLSKITKVTYTKLEVSPFSNGDKASCVTREFNSTVLANSTNATIIWEPPKANKNELYKSFTVYYKKQTASDGNLTSTFNSVDVCVVNEWNIVYTTNDNSALLTNLRPNTSYVYYITLYSSLNDSRQYIQGDMKNFSTLSDDPDGFVDLVLTPIDHHTIMLRWKPPQYPNGMLELYDLYYRELEDTFLSERDYCVDRTSIYGNEIDDSDTEFSIDFKSYNKTSLIKPENNCSCEIPKTLKPVEEDWVIVTKDIKLQLCHDLAPSGDKKSKCENTKYLPVEENKSNKEFKREEDETNTYQYIGILPNVTSYNITHLKPFTMYIFYMSACNYPKSENHCSGKLQRFARTKQKPGADEIQTINVEPEDETSVKITWNKPSKESHSSLVSYRIALGFANSTSTGACVRYFGNDNDTYTKIYKGLAPGKYVVSVNAETLMGDGKKSFFTFEIQSPNKYVTLIAVSITCILILAAMIVAYIIFRNRWKNKPLITLINPDYDGDIYVQDQWEMDKDDIELVKELGRGFFGTVYQGVILSRNQPCAVKVLNETLSMNQRMDFLKEASLMKSFCDCYHVVRLLGVVSLTQPPLVVMELMERGDLKHYLRKTRDSSHNLTATEVYRMAIEIADGMAYLSAKKFVHRDLAARNCMVASDRTVKVGDFGMARDIYTTDYYRKESKGLLPVRWMAPESLSDGVFTTDSDVWSYGIVLWEIATLAEQPYQGLSNEHVRQYVISRGRLSRPPQCSDLLYEVMKKCWSWKPINRPSFWDIVDLLEDRVSEDFKLVSFVHSREATLYSRQRVENPAALHVEPKDEIPCHYNVSDEDVSLQVGGVPRRPSYLQASLSHRRFTPPEPDDLY